MTLIHGEGSRFHDKEGRHVQPRISEWVRAAARGDSNRVVLGSEVTRDQANKANFHAHLREHLARGEAAQVYEPLSDDDEQGGEGHGGKHR